jgi:hypothetical protein
MSRKLKYSDEKFKAIMMFINTLCRFNIGSNNAEDWGFIEGLGARMQFLVDKRRIEEFEEYDDKYRR